MRNKKHEEWGGAESHAFYGAVCRNLTRATGREMRQIRKELAGHLQDHTEALMERGLGAEAAEVRAVAEMGDPAEIGKALNCSFSRFWLVMKRVVIVLFCAVLLQCFGPDILRTFSDNMLARLPSQTDLMEISGLGIAYENLILDLGATRRINLKLKSDSTVVRLEQIAVGAFEDSFGEEGYCVCVSASMYSRNPFVSCDSNLRLYTADDPDGLRFIRSLTSKAVGGRSSGTCFVYEVEYGTELVEFVWERYGQDLQIQVPLDWEGVS